MSGLDSHSDTTETEPPSRPRGLLIGSFLSHLIDHMGDGLQHSQYVSPNNDCHIAIDLREHEVRGEIDDYAISEVLLSLAESDAYDLERRVSASMARVASEQELVYPGEPDYSFPSFISTANKGGFALTSRFVPGVILGDRAVPSERPLRIKSEHIETTTGLIIFLGGLATLLTVVETTKHNLS